MRVINIFSKEKGSRLTYVLDFVFQEVLSCQWQFTDSISTADVVYGDGAKGKVLVTPSVFIQPYQTATSPHFKNGELFFNGETHFDVFAAIFFCLSRFEEYHAKLDTHQRFGAHSSVFCGSLERPWVDLWVKQIATSLGIDTDLESDFLMTVDLDFGFRFLGKGLLRNIGAFCRDVSSGNIKTALSRGKAIATNTDPYDAVYDWLKEEFTPAELNFFALSAPFSKYDKGLTPGNKAWKRLLNCIKGYPVGLHPSYHQMDNPKLLDVGKTNLESFGLKINSNRFHFLRFSLPNSYRLLLERGIIHDFSMGYADTLGFRAQTSRSFWFYGLETEQKTCLRIHPFVCMDAVLCNYKTLTKVEILQQLGGIIDEIKHIGGRLTLLWHEHTLQQSTDTRCLLEKILPLVKPLRNDG